MVFSFRSQRANDVCASSSDTITYPRSGTWTMSARCRLSVPCAWCGAPCTCGRSRSCGCALTGRVCSLGSLARSSSDRRNRDRHVAGVVSTRLCGVTCFQACVDGRRKPLPFRMERPSPAHLSSHSAGMLVSLSGSYATRLCALCCSLGRSSFARMSQLRTEATPSAGDRPGGRTVQQPPAPPVRTAASLGPPQVGPSGGYQAATPFLSFLLQRYQPRRVSRGPRRCSHRWVAFSAAHLCADRGHDVIRTS